MDEVEVKVLQYLRKHRLAGNQKLLVAVSGGPDSVCLLHVLHSISEEEGLTLHVVHLDHSLRGGESQADASYVRELAQKLGLQASIDARDVNAYQSSHHLSLEEAAREVRYAFIAEVAEKLHIDSVAVGHTRDDNIETIMMHLIRGSGTLGLTGLRPGSHREIGTKSLQIVRPLLEISRDETQAYCREYNLDPRIDSSNLSLSPLRNRIRLQLLPLMNSYNSNFNSAVLRTASIVAEEIDELNAADDKTWHSAVRIKNNTVVINKEIFCRLHSAAQKRLIRRAIERLREGAANPLKDIENVHIDEVIEAAHKPAGKRIILPYKLIFSVEYDQFIIGVDPAALCPFPPFKGTYSLNVPGKTVAGPWIITTKIINSDQVTKNKGLNAYFDLDKIGSLYLSSYRPGDSFQPLGMSESKKVSQFMIDSHISHCWRDRIPIIRSQKQILWLAGYRIDDRVKVTGHTSRVLMVQLRKHSTLSLKP